MYWRLIMGNIIHVSTIQILWLVLFDRIFTILYSFLHPNIMLLFHHVEIPLDEFSKTYVIIFQILHFICFKFMK